jgi:hypothetical protein
VQYRYRETSYHIVVRRTPVKDDEKTDATTVTVDGIVQGADFVLLTDDRQEHHVEVRILSRSPLPETIPA